MVSFARTIFILAVALTLSLPALAETAELQASKDNTLYESLGGDISNGAGQYFFAGETLMGDVRRGLIAFDVTSEIPRGSIIESVSLTLHMSKSLIGPLPVTLHRAQADWGEAASDAPGEEGAGGAAERGDATWIHTFSPGEFWTSVGGDFEAAPSASTDVGNVGFYTWSAAGMVADVQAWVDDTRANNFGWVVLAPEGTSPTTKRFDTRENPDESFRPVLTVEYSAAPPVPSMGTAGLLLLVTAFLAAGLLLLGGRRRVNAAS